MPKHAFQGLCSQLGDICREYVKIHLQRVNPKRAVKIFFMDILVPSHFFIPAGSGSSRWRKVGYLDFFYISCNDIAKQNPGGIETSSSMCSQDEVIGHLKCWSICQP